MIVTSSDGSDTTSWCQSYYTQRQPLNVQYVWVQEFSQSVHNKADIISELSAASPHLSVAYFNIFFAYKHYRNEDFVAFFPPVLKYDMNSKWLFSNEWNRMHLTIGFMTSLFHHFIFFTRYFHKFSLSTISNPSNWGRKQSLAFMVIFNIVQS